ncbi:hypothetical protein [Kineosporia succinea]|uniref:DNA primase n=1 Tax=Kineosporia succinea TaxID=84632 RepID=A0ABT9P4Q3_9ACTN|nr:hypothetical protein [Kineosporia succinea]MDP9827662.1 DNA primase [Kineosporia succinea]
MKRALLTLGATAAVAALVTTGVHLTQNHDQVATLDGETITRDELVFQMNRLSRSVDWDDNLNTLSEKAFDDIRHDRAVLTLAHEQGLVTSTTFGDFMQEVTTENQARSDATERGETVYGLTDFTPEEYYSHRLTDLTTQLQSKLGQEPGDPLWVSEAEVKQAFEQDRNDWAANATTYTYTELVTEPDAPLPDTEKLRQITEPGTSVRRATFTRSGNNAHDQELASILSTLDIGEISQPVVGTTQTTYYQLESKTVDSAQAYQTYAARIRQSLVSEKLDDLLEQREGASDLTVDPSAVNAIDAEDVQG